MDAKETSSSCNHPSWQSPDGSFIKTILEKGSGVDKPKECSICKIFVDPLSISSADSCTIKGFSYPTGCWFQAELGEGETPLDCLVDQCLETMLSGEVCQVETAKGMKFKLRMASFENGKEPWEIDTNEKIQRAMRDHEKGGKAYREGCIEVAERRYSRALRLLACIPEEAVKERITLLANLAACDLKMGRMSEADKRCSRVLEKEPGYVKALYRRGMARAGMSDWKGARKDFEALLRLDPANKEAQRELIKAREGEKKEQLKISKALGKMFI
ncbi:FK506-binding protein-like [Xenopus laevis]|uniref:FK506-binding protein-like n=2 Tax=Xenopus laevis TaxID=8355 RepID=A0A1L8F3P3_XENLA|nr:FK506-binding protein-like [Xenopus laevis]XP_018088732.1 FK506-binding protein-like [Xenopus laevis]OCT66187.1 hypothetical protein XELAEV_18042443mg [Xenopus laevis]